MFKNRLENFWIGRLQLRSYRAQVPDRDNKAGTTCSPISFSRFCIDFVIVTFFIFKGQLLQCSFLEPCCPARACVSYCLDFHL